MADKIKFLKIRDVKTPDRAFNYDAGIDFYIPKFNSAFIKDLKEKNPTIFKVNIPTSTGGAWVTGSGTLCITNQSADITFDLNDKNDSIIKFDDEEGKNYFLLSPGSRINIPSGIKVRMCKPGRALIANNKSGVASKHGLIFGAAVVDYLYQGEIHLNVINTSNKVVRIYEDMKILQFIETPVFNSEIETVESNVPEFAQEFYKGMEKDRGEGGFGSSDKK